MDPSKDSFLYSYPLRRYMSLNGKKDLTVEERNTRLDTAFDYLNALFMALLDVDERKLDGQYEMTEKAKNARSRIDEMNVTCGDGNLSPFDELRENGLVYQESKTHFSAMNYLICKGYTFPFATSKGLAFEKMVALHLVRFYESRGKKVSLHTLRKQIPNSTIPVVVNGIDEIEWKEMQKTTKSDVYVILQPMENSAQGPDIMVLRNGPNDNKGQMTLDLYQAKSTIKKLEKLTKF